MRDMVDVKWMLVIMMMIGSGRCFSVWKPIKNVKVSLLSSPLLNNEATRKGRRIIKENVNSDRIRIKGMTKPNKEVSVDDALSIYYRPPSSNYFLGHKRRNLPLTLYAGFNGWNGEMLNQEKQNERNVDDDNDDDDDEDDESMTVLTIPLFPYDDLEYRGLLVVPNFARSIDFCVTDGVKYDYASVVDDSNNNNMSVDDDDDMEFFRIHVTNVKMADPNNAKRILSYRHDAETGELTHQKDQDEEEHDPLELERMVREEYERRNNNKDSLPKQEEEKKETVMWDVEVRDGLFPQETVLTVRDGAEKEVRTYMAEAQVYGEALGLGNIQIGEARTAFDMYSDRNNNSRITIPNVDLALRELGWNDLSPERISELITDHMHDNNSNNDDNTIGMKEFIGIYAELDGDDSNYDIV